MVLERFNVPDEKAVFVPAEAMRKVRSDRGTGSTLSSWLPWTMNVAALHITHICEINSKHLFVFLELLSAE